MPKPGYVHLEGVGGSAWRLAGPQGVDESIDGDDLVGVKEQDGEDRTLLGRSQIGDRPVRGDLEWPQDPVLEHDSGACAPS